MAYANLIGFANTKPFCPENEPIGFELEEPK
jgi:hypothetical protein